LTTCSPIPFIVLISANSEWRIALEILKPSQTNVSSVGEWFESSVGSQKVVFFHSGWGKTRSAAATQLVIDRWQPELVINLGTCGGLEGFATLGEILLVTNTVMYDIFERMGDSQQAVNYYRSELDTEWIGTALPENTRRATLASADQDIDFRNFEVLTQEFGVPAADWESSAIAWVLKANGVRGLILRGVSDIITPLASETDNNHSLWRSRVEMIIRKLLHDLPFYLDNFLNK
jgi:adenosylhomocysteine nucleosidase